MARGELPGTIELTGDAARGVRPDLAALERAPATVRLGRIRPAARPQALALSEYIDLKRVAPKLPDKVDYAEKAMESLKRIYLNDRYGDCVVAGKYHIAGVLTGNDTGKALLGTDDEVYRMYQVICGPGDNGCVITDVLDWYKSKGLPFSGQTRKIDGYVAVNWTNKDLVKAAVWLFGNATIGFNLPEAWHSSAVWDVTDTRIVGGHDVCCVGYDAEGVYIASWGRVYLITWAAFTSRRWVEEQYVLLSADWYGDDSLAPSGLKVDELRRDLDKLAHGDIPDVAPPPEPPPEPPPRPPQPPGPPAPHEPLTVKLKGTLYAGRQRQRIELEGTAAPAAQAPPPEPKAKKRARPRR